MPEPVGRDELRAWIAGHETANARQLDEIRAMSAEEKLRQLSRLMQSRSLFDMSRRAEGNQLVIDLWQRLRARWPTGK
jgi:hypothetical protein